MRGKVPLMKSILLIPILVLLAAGQQTDSRPVILAFGNSLTAGFGVPPPALGYPEQLQSRLDANGYKYRVVNTGVSGDTTNGGRARMGRALLTSPAIVILELGGNDRANGLLPSQTQANLEQMIAAFQKAGASVVLAGRVLPGKDNVFSDLAGKYHLIWIPDLLAGVAGDPRLTIGDGVHPNADGYAIVVTTVMKAIEPLLKK